MGQTRPARNGTSRPKVAACVRRFCLDCLGLTSARGAFDCQSRVCPLYQASPFRRVGRRRATKGLVVSYCRHCQPGDRSDCGGDDCALYRYRPWPGPGHAARRKASPAQREAAARGRESMRQKGSTAVGAALDA